MSLSFGGYCCPKYWDFMSVTAMTPINWAAAAYDLTTPMQLQNFSGSDGFADYKLWPLQSFNNNVGWDKQCYATITTITTYNTGLVTVSVTSNKPWFFNPNNPTALLTSLPGGLPGAGGVTNPTNSVPAPDPTSEFRLFGIPGGGCENVESSFDNGVTLTLVSGTPGTYPDYYSSSGKPGLYFQGRNTGDYGGFDQTSCPPPTVTPTSCTQFFPDGTSGGVYDGSSIGKAIRIGATSVTIILSDAVDTPATCAALCNSVPLSPLSLMTTREGPLYFDYFRTSSTVNGSPISGYSYGVDGTASIPVTPNQLYGITLGANENLLSDPTPTISTGFGIPGVVVGGTPPFVNFVYLWNGVTTYGITATADEKTQLKCPGWADGTSTNNSATGPYPDCWTFMVQGSSVTLNGGWQGFSQWAPGGTAAPMGIVTNVISTGHGAYYKLQSTLGGTNSFTEPDWSTMSVGGTITDTGSDGSGVVWTLLAKGAPVTATITPTRVNRLIIFPLNTGNVITAQADSTMTCYPAQLNDPQGDLDSGSAPENFPACLIAQASRIRVPPNPLSFTATTDVACMSDMAGIFPDLELNINVCLSLSGGRPDWTNQSRTGLYEILSVGETILGPGSVSSSPTGFGWIDFGAQGDINWSPSSGAGSGGPPTSAGATSQDTGGL